MRAIQNFPHDAGRIEMYSRRVLADIIIGERVLVLEQEVVHLPKLSLNASRFGSLGRVLRMRMRIDHWKIAKDKAEAIPQAFLNLLYGWISVPAVRAFIIAVFDQYDRRINATLNVISSCNRPDEF